MWVQTCVHICSEVCEGVQDWRSEVDFGVLKCLCMIIFETGILTKAETQVFHYIGWQRILGIFLSFPSHHWGYKCSPSHLVLGVESEDTNSGLFVLRKALYWLNQLPNTQRYNLSKYITDLLTDLHILCTKYE